MPYLGLGERVYSCLNSGKVAFAQCGTSKKISSDALDVFRRTGTGRGGGSAGRRGWSWRQTRYLRGGRVSLMFSHFVTLLSLVHELSLCSNIRGDHVDSIRIITRSSQW